MLFGVGKTNNINKHINKQYYFVAGNGRMDYKVFWKRIIKIETYKKNNCVRDLPSHTKSWSVADRGTKSNSHAKLTLLRVYVSIQR